MGEKTAVCKILEISGLSAFFGTFATRNLSKRDCECTVCQVLRRPNYFTLATLFKKTSKTCRKRSCSQYPECCGYPSFKCPIPPKYTWTWGFKTKLKILEKIKKYFHLDKKWPGYL